jgi:enoyl-CoA hydratase
MTTLLVHASKHDGVMVLELRNPPANTYSYEMMRALDAHVLDARMDESVHVIVITGARPAAAEAGKKPAPEFFCAGADIGMLEGANPYFKYDGAL